MRVVFLWHLHQPEYRVDGRFLRPWVYLHALSGYTDMAVRLERCPDMRAVVNLTPVLIDQLDDYATRLRRWRATGHSIGDALLDALAVLPERGDGRAGVVRACLPPRDSPRPRRNLHYRAAAEAAAAHEPAAVPDELLSDLLVAFHLAWLGPSIRAGDARAARLLEQGSGSGRDARRALLELIGDALSNLLPRWRALGGQGRVELATSPYYHPLSPLLLGFRSALESAPSATIPAEDYPGGADRLAWHIAEGRGRFRAQFGQDAAGCWPPEGALSDATIGALAAGGFAWTASSRAVLEATFAYHDTAVREPFGLFRHAASGLYCAFRDDGLSDRIGFEYQHWQPQDAVRDLVARLEAIGAQPGSQLALIALDGENPWEYYPDEGAEFLDGLYQALCAHPRLRPATMQDCLRDCGSAAADLPALRAGSWVHGQLLTWVGHREKNRAWQWLVEAKRRCDSDARSDGGELAHRLGACEGSDWFWWPGVHNPAPSVAQFDELFRAHLAALYRACGDEPPDALARPFATGVDAEVAAGGTMQRGA
jgi:alpha-amylase/alpha-mannosidase (GH57 family)